MTITKNIHGCTCGRNSKITYAYWRLRLGLMRLAILTILLTCAILFCKDNGLLLGLAGLGALYLLLAAYKVAKGHGIRCSLRSTVLYIFDLAGSPMP